MKYVNNKTVKHNNKKLQVILRIIVVVNIIFAFISAGWDIPIKILLFYSTQQYEETDLSCYKEAEVDDLLLLDSAFIPNKSIFFMETSCKGGIDARQACAVESAARNNPEWQITVLFLGPVPPTIRAAAPLSQLLSYENVKLLRNIIKHEKEAPFLRVLTRRVKIHSYEGGHNTANLIKYLLLYTYGGVYLDTDVIIVRSFDSLPKNWVAKKDMHNFASGAISLSKDQLGMSVAREILEDIVKYLDPKMKNYDDTMPVKRTITNLCPTVAIENISATTCKGFEVFDAKYFYPVDYSTRNHYFDKPRQLKLGDTYAFKTWYKESRGVKIMKGSLYDQLAEKFCPTIYNTYMGRL